MWLRPNTGCRPGKLAIFNKFCGAGAVTRVRSGIKGFGSDGPEPVPNVQH
jgi:hypothetical protein